MLANTDYTVDTKLFQEACDSLPKSGMKTTINEPTGKFFYDPWVLKDEYKGTVWETLYNSLPVDKGEARIIILDPNQCYQSHADIDDRYHLNILGEDCYLINLIHSQMHKLEQNGVWQTMDTSFIHTAANFGRKSRVQLVVRHLLNKNTLIDSVEVALSTTMSDEMDARFLFDMTMSPWLNGANKLGFINNFDHSAISIKFNIERDRLDALKRALPSEFKIL
jgi:hypothetical protein